MEKDTNNIYRFVWVSAWYAFAAIVVLVATLFATLRLLLPYAEQYNAEIGERLSGYLGQRVLVRALDTEWHGWGPSLVLRDAALLDAKGKQSVLQLDKLRMDFDLFGSVRHWQPVFSHITLVGVDLTLTRTRNGKLLVAGLSTPSSAAVQDSDQVTPFAAWLFSQGQLGLENSAVTWRDEMGAGRKIHFSAVNVVLRNDGDRHQLDASVRLSRDLGKSLILRVDMQGNPLQAKGRRTQIYAAGEHVRLTELVDTQSLAGVDVSVKSTSFKIWANWREGQLQQIEGNVDAAGLALTAVASANDASINVAVGDKKAVVPLVRLAGDFIWQREANGWQFDGNNLLLARESRQWQPSRMSLKFMESPEGVASLDASASFLQLEDIAQLLSLFSVGGDAVQKPLFAIGPRGEIRNAEVSWYGGEKPRYRAFAMLRNASVNAWRSVPEAKKVDGQLWLDNGSGQVVLQHAAVVLNFPNLFRWPLPVDELRGNVAWQQEGQYWRVMGRDLEASNEDISASATLDVVHDAESASPFMSLLVNFHDGDGSQVARYLPTGIMSVAVVNWLDEAIVGARVVSGGALFFGRLTDFPFDRGDGRFEVSFSVENASLNYAEAWPPITGITADVRFLGRGMSVVAQKGKIFSNEIQWANVAIDDMSAKPFRLTVKGEVQGATQEKLDYLVTSPPLYKAFAQYLAGMEAEGESLLNLDLSLPIGSTEPAQVEGWLTMKNNTLSISPLGQVLNEVNGRLEFFQKGLQAETIQAKLFGQPTQINITTDQADLVPLVWIRAKGMVDAEDLAARYLPSIKDLLAGNGDWDISFAIPISENKREKAGVGATAEVNRVAVLQARTNLKGIEARLPPPFDKKAEDAGNLELRVDFQPKQSPLLRVNYEGFVDGVFALSDRQAAEGFRGEVRLNGGAAEMPATPGLRVTGWLDTVSLDDWRNLNLAESLATKDEQSAPLLTSADIAVRKMQAYGQPLHNVRFKLSTVEKGLQADIDSKELKGQVLLPLDLQLGPVRADLKYCYLVEPDDGAEDWDPRNIPALDFRIEDFRYKDSAFGQLRLETAKVADGVRIEQLVLKPRSTTITAQGGWYVRGAQQNSNVKVHVESSNVGNTLKALAYVGGIDNGKGHADLELQWPGSFPSVNASQIQGSLDISLKDGYLLDIDPGAGRMFGMLSIQALPRRLLLDFSDVFKKGFGFDKIKGSFRIEDGDAYTSDLFMDGPSARVDVTGRTGLAQQDYDQLVTVTPHLTETLPMLGILAATPQVGAAILAIQKLFLPGIDDATQNQYTITGHWNEPKIKKLKTAKSATRATGEEEP